MRKDKKYENLRGSLIRSAIQDSFNKALNAKPINLYDIGYDANKNPIQKSTQVFIIDGNAYTKEAAAEYILAMYPWWKDE